MTLHEAIVQVLQEARRPMTTREIADAVNQRKLYHRKDGKPVPAKQIGARVNNHPELFIKDNSKIGLVHWQDTHV
ncbi:MAG: hypothetical protein CVU39_22120 [Chloroflexi bacterium HGW-Chloroflexi-10]|nr:MAG: hypothetical protein CVU39_22120 [Chloroflexi bacterium HGW-Chloroflexi-10]